MQKQESKHGIKELTTEIHEAKTTEINKKNKRK